VSVGGPLGPVPWWSFTKTILAIAALRLSEDGLIPLNKPLFGGRFTLTHRLRQGRFAGRFRNTAAPSSRMARGHVPSGRRRSWTPISSRPWPSSGF